MAHARGMCAAHYARWRRLGTPGRSEIRTYEPGVMYLCPNHPDEPATDPYQVCEKCTTIAEQERATRDAADRKSPPFRR